MSQQKYPKAYEAYQQAVYRDGRNPTFWCSIGVLYYQINQYRDALDAYSRAIRLNPYISEVWYDLGTLVGLRGIQLGLFETLLTDLHSMNLATIKSMMLSMHTNVLQSLIQRTSTSRLASSCSEVDKLMECQFKPVLPSHKMFTHKPIKPLELLALLVHNGATQVHSSLLQALQEHQPTIGEVDSLRSILHLILPIHMINESKLVGQDLALSQLLLASRAPPDKASEWGLTQAL